MMDRWGHPSRGARGVQMIFTRTKRSQSPIRLGAEGVEQVATV
jgi:hypothetical protein